MNIFEKDVQSQRNDFSDSIASFIVAVGFFASIFIIAQVIKALGA